MHNRIKTARLSKKTSQSQLAKLLNVSRSAVGQWESIEGTLPNVYNLVQLSEILEVNLEWLILGSSPKKYKIPEEIIEIPVKEEKEILKIIKKMPIGKKRALLNFLRYF